MKAATVYLMADPNIQNDAPFLRMTDICQIYCQDETVCRYLQGLPLLDCPADGNGRMILSVFTIIERMLQAVAEHYPEWTLDFVNLGAQEIIVETKLPRKTAKWLDWLKAAFVSLVVFVGAAFTIMTYNEDVDVTGVFARIYLMLLGRVPETPGALEISYAVGIAIGVLMFFNPFTASQKRKEPSPIEIEMEKYEADIQDTIIKMNQRGSGGR